ncbi:MAG: ImmA/IrrE family metallo-endopeptidase [Chloroflexota bacterium]|nr:ImmA/IrrE family metallo-endopeptidase [Chloroflexota bacterium]
MTRARRRGADLRRKLGLTGRVDAETVANLHGFAVQRLPLLIQKELEVDGYIGIADRLGPEDTRWYIAHSLGHKLMHPGNHLWVYRNSMLGCKYEREANDFARNLLTDDWEAIKEGLTCSLEVAHYFGVPEEFVRLQAPLGFRGRADETVGS